MIDEPLPGSFRPSDSYPLPPQDKSPKELRVAPAGDLVAKYKLFQQATGANVNVVYHPCSATDISPSAAFPNSRVIYVEKDEDSVNALTKAGYEVHHASALEFNPC